MPSRAVLEINDFSGGLTENYISGKSNRFLAADNLLMLPDGDKGAQLVTRPGSQVIDNTNYQLPTGIQRVSELINFNSNSELLAVSGKQMYYLDPNWTSLLGPTGNNPWDTATASTIHRHAQWQKQLFLVSNSGDLPLKVYRDDAGVLNLVTAGLPEVSNTRNSTDVLLLGALIANSDHLRTKMLAHFNDFGGLGTNQHKALDAAGDAALTALVPAVTLGDVTAYITTLCSVYTDHVNDAQIEVTPSGPPTPQAFHKDRNKTIYDTFSATGGVESGTYAALNFDLDPSLPIGTTLEELRVKLNDLMMRWHMHSYATFTHGEQADHGIDRPTLPFSVPIPETSGPDVQQNLEHMYRFTEALWNEYEGHRVDTSLHMKSDTVNVLSSYIQGLPGGLASSKTEAIIAYAHLAHNFGRHSRDADYDLMPIGFTSPYKRTYEKVVATGSTIGVPTVTTTTDPRLVYQVGNYFKRYAIATAAPYFWGSTLFSPGTKIQSMTANSITFDTNALATVTGNFSLVCSASEYHKNFNGDPAAIINSIDVKTTLDNMNPKFDLSALALAYSNLKASIKAHHTSTGGGWAGSDTSGTLYPPHEFYTLEGQEPLFPQYLPQNKIILDINPTVKTWLYQFVLFFPYKVGDISYEDRGPIMSITRSMEGIESPSNENAVDEALYGTSIITIPSLINTAAQNYGDTAVSIEIYRTQGDGINFYKVGSIVNNNAITSFTDKVLDVNLTKGLSLYVNGGIVSNDPPPVSKTIHIVNNKAYYGDITDIDGVEFPYRVRESIVNDPDSCPSDFYDDFDSTVVAISSFKHIPIVLCSKGIYRLIGGFDILGRGGLSHEIIADEIGCISSKGVVQTEVGCIFAGTDGFYWTDGYTVMKISSELDRTYASFTSNANQKSRISSTYDPFKKIAMWTMQTNPADTDCNVVFALDLRFGIRPDGAFTTMSNGADWRPSTVSMFNNRLYRGDERGYVLKHDDSYTTDPRIDTAVAANVWAKKAIRFNYVSCTTDFGRPDVRKWVTRFNFIAKDKGDLSVAINSINDNGRHFSNLKPIRFRGNSPDQGSTALLALPVAIPETFDGLIDEWRRYTTGTLRCSYKQMQLTTAYTTIESSSVKGTASTNGAANTVTLDIGTNSWVTDTEDYAIAFDNDGYLAEWVVSARTSNTVLTVLDPGNTLATLPTRKWVLRGYPKGERMHLYSMSMVFGLLGDSQKGYDGDVAEGVTNP